MNKLLEGYFLLYAILAVGLVGLVSRVVLSKTVRNLVKEAENMGTTSQELLLLIKRKYEAGALVNRSIQNTEVFVERYLHRYQTGGMTLKRIGSITYEMMLCAMILGCIGGVGAYFEEMAIRQIVLYPAAAVLIVMLLLFCEAFLEIEGKLEQLKLMIIDYLENTMEPRLKQQRTDKEEEPKKTKLEKEKSFDGEIPENAAVNEVTVALAWESPEEEKLVKEVLDEYLT